MISDPVYPWRTSLNIQQPNGTYLEFPVYYEVCGYEQLDLNATTLGGGSTNPASTEFDITKADLNTTN